MALSPTSWSQMTSDLMGLQPVILDSPNAMNAVDGATIEQRICISQRLPRCRLKPVVDRADADGDVKQIAQQLFYASVRTAAGQDQGQRQLAQPRFGHRQIEKYAVILGGKRLIKRFRCLLLLPIENLPANSLPISQMSDRFDSDKIARPLRASLVRLAAIDGDEFMPILVPKKYGKPSITYRSTP
jgi:hypothetical protein